VAWQLSLLAIIDPYVTINVKDCGLLGRTLHPLFTQRFTPLLGTVVLRQLFDFKAQGADFRDTIQSNQFAPFSRGAIA
jgi:hypothetical protein